MIHTLLSLLFQSIMTRSLIIQMLTDKPLKERDLDELYDWVDSLELSRPKKYPLIHAGTSAEISPMPL